MPKTLIPPSAEDPSKAPIENLLELTSLAIIDKDLFTNSRPLWHPPGARGIYGGAAISQSLAAAQRTVPEPSRANNFARFYPHSMHCYFVLAGDADIPVVYSVERVREGRSFLTRTVQARQEGRCIFTTTISFSREGSAGKKTINHEASLPNGVTAELDQILEREKTNPPPTPTAPFEGRRIALMNAHSERPETKRTRQWIKARGAISPSAGQDAHLSALAYMSDSLFIGTVGRVQNLWRFSSPNKTTEVPAVEPVGEPALTVMNKDTPDHAREAAAIEDLENRGAQGPPRKVGMMVSLDHSIYFHKPAAIRADEWMLQEMESPWAGDGRGLVMQRVWNRQGELLATCVQEGVVRLMQDEPKGKL